MTDDGARPPVLVLSSSWHLPETELSFVTRALAGAASRSGVVTVGTQMAAGTNVPDGAFDLRGMGRGRRGGWPDPTEVQLVPGADPKSVWVFDEFDDSALALFEAFGNGSTAYSVNPSPPDAGVGATPLPFAAGPGRASSGPLGAYVPVNPLAATHRHGGLGFTGYLLVLTDRPSTPAVAPPTPAVAWLTARFHRQHVVVVEGASAAVWRGRALRGVVGVNTRIDLWRLMAHAWAMVDLAPGAIIARECVESLRFGTPILVPGGAEGAAPVHAEAGGGYTFAGVPELLDRVEHLLDPPERERCASQGADYANARFGDPAAFVTNVAHVLHLTP